MLHNRKKYEKSTVILGNFGPHQRQFVTVLQNNVGTELLQSNCDLYQGITDYPVELIYII